jgi:hypothetical protein
MANVKEAAKAAAPVVNRDNLKKLKTIFVPYAKAGEEQKLFVAVNGRTYSVPRGKNVTLPKYIADTIEHALKMEAKYEAEVAHTYEG